MIDLRRRFEAPIEKNRWDFPLFRTYTVLDPTIADSRKESQNNSENPSKDDSGDDTGGNCGDKSGVSTADTATTTMPVDVAAVPVQVATVLTKQQQPLTSTRGMIDINCLAVDKITKIEFRPETVFDKVTTAPASSSWRPKIRSDSSVRTTRTFTTLGGESNTTKVVDSSSSVNGSGSCIGTGPFSALSISGSIPVISPDEQLQSIESVMQLIYLHLTNTGHIAAPNSSTISVPRVNADLLHEIDRTSQSITQRIVAHQSENVEGIFYGNIVYGNIFYGNLPLLPLLKI